MAVLPIDELKKKIDSNIYQNSQQAITGTRMNTILNDMVDSLDETETLNALSKGLESVGQGVQTNKEEADAKLTELEQELKIRPITGLQYNVVPTRIESNTLYRVDETTFPLGGYDAKTYSLTTGSSVKIKVLKDFPSENLSIIAYRNKDGIFKSILSSPLNAVDQPNVYITITSEISELITVGCELTGINSDVNLAIKEDITDFAELTELTYLTKEYGWVNAENIKIENSSFYLYKFDVRGSSKLKLYFASLGSFSLFTDEENNIVGTPFRNTSDGSSKSTWKEIDVPEGAVYLKLSHLNNNAVNEYPNAYPCKVLANRKNFDEISDTIIRKNYIDLIYSSRKDGWINAENVESANAAMCLYEFDVRNSTKLKVYFATGAAWALFLDADENIVGEPFQSTPIGNDFFASTWKDVEVPQGAVTLRLSHVKLSNSFPLAYPCRVLADKQNYDKLKSGKSVIHKTMVNVGMSIWWQDGRTFSESNQIDGNGALVKGYQTLLQEVFVFNKVVMYAYSGFSLGVGDLESSSIMATKANTWTSQPNAVWTLDTITNDFGRMVPLGVPSDFDNNTGINTFYGALRAFKDKVEELSPNAIVVCSNALYRTKRINSLNLTLEDYETAMCYAAAKSGWYFVDQYRNSINDANIGVALYDGIHATNFGFRLAVKPWIEQFRILQNL